MGECNEKTHTEIENTQEGLTLPMNLHCELARWGHHYRNGTLHLLKRTLVLDVSEHGKQECDGFPRASLGYTDDVSPRHDSRYCLCLDGCRSNIVKLLDDIETECQLSLIITRTTKCLLTNSREVRSGSTS